MALVGFDAEGASWRVAAEPDVWTDRSLVEDTVSGASSAGAGCFTFRCSRLWANLRWGHWDEDVGENAVVSACRFLFRELNSRVVLALHADDGVHLGVDNLGVVRCVGRFLDGRTTSRPAELVKDGDLLLLIERMLCLRGLDTVRISKVMGHADDDLVRAGVFVIWIGGVIMGPMRLLILAVGGCLGGLLMLSVIILGCVFFGALLSWACIGFLLPLPGLLSTMMVLLVLLWILWYGLSEVPLRGVGLDRTFLPGPAGCCCDSYYLP